MQWVPGHEQLLTALFLPESRRISIELQQGCFTRRLTFSSVDLTSFCSQTQVCIPAACLLSIESLWEAPHSYFQDSNIGLVLPQGQSHGFLLIKLMRAPTFSLYNQQQPGEWKGCQDFTDGEASQLK